MRGYQVYQNHLRITRTLAPGSVDLVVWPEGSTGSWTADPINAPEVGEAMGAEAARIGAVLLAGGDRPLNDTHWVNANVVFDQSGQIVGEYTQTAPGSLRRVRAGPGLVRVGRRVGSRAPGHDPGRRTPPVGPGIRPVRIGHLLRGVVCPLRQGDRETRSAGLLILATSQESYPYSVASDQFIGITRMRAAELGMPLIHTAVTGPLHHHHPLGRDRSPDRSGRRGPAVGRGADANLWGRLSMSDWETGCRSWR